MSARNLSQQFTMTTSRVGRLESGDVEGRRVKDLAPEEITNADTPGGEDGDPTYGNYEGLKSSVAKHGIKEPIVVKGTKLWEGHHRYLAAKELGIKKIPVQRMK